MDARRVTVTLDDEHLATIREVADALQEQGLELDEVLDAVGIVTGTTTDPAALRQVEGVASVDAEMDFQLPDPGAEIQ